MTKKTRTKLFLFFVFLFFIITPWASLYTTGYKLNLSWPPKLNTVLQKTGMFVIETDPPGAQILLNDQTPQSFWQSITNNQAFIETPAKIKNLLPDSYNVKIDLAGYWPWQKKLSIQPGEVTMMNNIKLFKKSIPLQIASTDTKKISISPDQKNIAYTENGKLSSINLETEEKRTAQINDLSAEEKINWSSDSKKILVKNKIITLDSKLSMTDLDQLIGKNLKAIKWGDDGSSRIYYEYLNTINYFDLEKNLAGKIAELDDYQDYIIKNNKLIIISRSAQGSKLKSINIKNQETEKEIDIPMADNYELLNIPDKKLIHLYDTKLKILYLIDLDAFLSPLKEIINNIKYINWINDDEMLYANEFEIWIFNTADNQKKLITRLSEPIQEIFWHPSNNYVVYVTEKNINIIELEKIERRNVTELLNLKNIESPQIDKENEIIYFTAQIGNQEGIYKLEL